MTALGILLLGGCTTHINPPEDPEQPKHTGFEERLNIRYSPEGWPETLYADLYLTGGKTPGPAVLVTTFLFRASVMGEALAFLLEHTR